MISGFGGGFFFGPFSSTQGIGQFTMNPGAVLGQYGAWAHLAKPILTQAGRWLQITIWPNAYGAIYIVQLALGSVGKEVLWQPSDGSGFYIDWFSAIKWNVPYVISFPTTTQVGQEISCRCSSAPGGTNQLAATVYLWN